jgi:hypothetical protein
MNVRAAKVKKLTVTMKDVYKVFLRNYRISSPLHFRYSLLIDAF